jgi:large subunit ribosomal protein L17
MRHNKKFNHLGRQAAHRNSMLSNMSASLIMHKRIFTTTAKAKALKLVVEPLITKAKEDSTASRRHVFSILQDKEAVTELFKTVSPKVGDRPGGYTRIIKTGFRLGDNAQMCFIELVDFDDNMMKSKTDKKVRTRRSTVKKKTEVTEKSVDEATEVRETKAQTAKVKKAKAPATEAPAIEASEAETPETQEPETEAATEASSPEVAVEESPVVEDPETEKPAAE